MQNYPVGKELRRQVVYLQHHGGYFNPECENHNKSRLLFSSAEMFKKPLSWQTVWTQQSVLGSTLFASILNLSVMLGNYLQQTTTADDIFRCIFFLAL